MTAPIPNPNQLLNSAVTRICPANQKQWQWSVPKQKQHGDFATNAALALAGQMGSPPMEVAQQIADALGQTPGVKATVAKPGFVNVCFADEWFWQKAQSLAQLGKEFGKNHNGKKVHLEFVSANPTGPVHIGGARGAAYGSALANLLRFYGDQVFCEYYINDHGNQIGLLASSVKAAAAGEDIPADGYQGNYIFQIAENLQQELGLLSQQSEETVAKKAVDSILEGVKQSLLDFGVEFDGWFSENSLYDHYNHGVKYCIEMLKHGGYVENKDGALWLKTSMFGDDKDRVLRKENGEYTYFASDIAYHQNKRERGFDQIINVLGADHHGYLARVAAAYKMLGGSPEELRPVIMQMVSVQKDGKEFKQSKRKGDFVTLEDLQKEIGKDAARWYLLSRSGDSTISFNVEEAKNQKESNPVHYVRYAHARACSVLQKNQNAQPSVSGQAEPLQTAERSLLLKLLQWPEIVEQSRDFLEPHRIAVYATALAQEFSRFYHDCFVIHPTVNQATRENRVLLVQSTKQVLALALGILGISAPQYMPAKQEETS